MNNDYYDGPKKWVKYKPREVFTKPEEPEISITKTPKPPIPLEIIDTLRVRASLPRKRYAYGRNDELWDNVINLKGWLSKPATDYSMAPILWERVKKMLDVAITGHDPLMFEQFADAWRAKSDVKSTGKDRRRSENIKINPEVLKSIEDMIPAPSSTTPGQPTAIIILEIIEVFQKKNRRSPTQKEIADAAAVIGFRLSEGDVSTQIADLGLGDFMSRA